MSRKAAIAVAQTIGIDTGKNTLHLIGLDDQGAVVLREKVARGRIAARLANVPQCLIGIEAGMATHYVARVLSALGHDVKQVPPAYAKPFRMGTLTWCGTLSRSGLSIARSKANVTRIGYASLRSRRLVFASEPRA